MGEFGDPRVKRKLKKTRIKEALGLPTNKSLLELLLEELPDETQDSVDKVLQQLEKKFIRNLRKETTRRGKGEE